MNPFSWRGFTALSSLLYLSIIIVTIPLAFDVGGEDCGIAFTGTLSLFYLILSTLRILARNTKFRYLTSTLYHLQQIIIPSLLILHLSIFSSSSSNPDESQPLSSTTDPILKFWLMLLEPWRWFVKNATPLFTTMEGFCTLLVIQMTGKLSTYLVRRRSDSWIIPQLLFSSCVFSSSLYFLYRIYTFPVTISLASATLIGVVLTVTAFLALFGIIGGRGNSVESALLFSYVVYCLYFTFTDFQSSFSAETFLYFFASSTRPDIPPLPPVIINGYTNFVSSVASLVPTSFKTVFQFLRGAVSTVTPSVFVSLSYRLSVFWAATRIIPAVRQVSSSLSRSQSVASLTLSPNRSSTSINTMDSVPTSSRLRKIRSQSSLKNSPATTNGVRSASAGATITRSMGSTLRHRHEQENHNSSRFNEDDDDIILSPSSNSSKHISPYTDESAILDDSDKEYDSLTSTTSAISSSTTITSTFNGTISARSNKTTVADLSSASMNGTSTLSENGSSSAYSNDYYDNDDADNLKEKYIPYSFHDHYNLNNDTKTISNDDDYYDNSYMNDDYDSYPNKNFTYSNHQQSQKEHNPQANPYTTIENDTAHKISKNQSSNRISFQLLIFAYGPCILIAVYTHLLIQHLAIFNTISSEYSHNRSDILGDRPKFGYVENMVEATTQTAIALASTVAGRAARGALLASGASLSNASSICKNAIETAASSASAYISLATAAASSSILGGENLNNNNPPDITWVASKIILIKDALTSIWYWSRSWVSTPRDSWQFWGWVNMFSTLALYALELMYGTHGANEEIIEYHWKTE